MPDKFNLKWNDFQSNVSRTFSQLRSEDEFFDVSLVSDDEKMMSAHKLVLSASSPYFKHILTTNKHSHPLLCLDGVSSAELQCVLDYIYHGEVLIHKEQLDRFLEVAQRLKLEGLICQDDEKERIMKETREEVDIHFEDNSERGKENDIKIEDIQSEAPENEKRRSRKSSTIAVAGSFSDLNTKEINQKIDEYLIRAEDGSYSCGVCGKTGDNARNQKQNMRNHLETHMEGLSFPCQSCNQTFRSRPLLSNHKSRFHRRQ